MLKSPSLVLALVAAPVAAQTPANVVPYGSPCGSVCSVAAGNMSWEGLPQLGATAFTVRPGWWSNWPGYMPCYSPSSSTVYSETFVLAGSSATSLPFSNSAFTSGNGCLVLVSPDVVLKAVPVPPPGWQPGGFPPPPGGHQLGVVFAIPNMPNLAGFQFNVQSYHVRFTNLNQAHSAFSDALQCTVGI